MRKRPAYRGSQPYRPPPALHRWVNRGVAALAGAGVTPADTVALEVRGRRSGRRRRTAVVWAEVAGKRYLVSLGGEASWVRNVRTTGGVASVAHGRRVPVRLVEVPVVDRPPVLLAYASKRAFSRPPSYVAQEYLGVSASPTLDELAGVATRYPVFAMEPLTQGAGPVSWPEPSKQLETIRHWLRRVPGALLSSRQVWGRRRPRPSRRGRCGAGRLAR